MKRLAAVMVGGLLVAGLVGWGVVAAQSQPPAPKADGANGSKDNKQGILSQLAGQQPDAPMANIVRQGFPAGNADPDDLTKSDTAWEIDWTITSPHNGYRDPKKKTRGSSTPSSVLAIRSAKFMYKDKNGQPRWITVLKNLELGEMFVPYDTTSPTFLDVARFSFHILPAKKEYLGPNCVAPGEILTSADPRMNNKVLKEVHDDGVRWMNNSNVTRRGEKMMLWATLSAGNYRYLIEYTFKDDGIITCRVGATARNYFNRQKDMRDVHLHVGCWRWDMELSDPFDPKAGGADQNVVRMVRRLPREGKPGHFYVDEKSFNPGSDGQAREGHEDWVPEEFTTLRIESTTRKNNNPTPQPTGYDVIPLRYGSVRNYPTGRKWVNHDFWVTHTNQAHTTYEKVAKYAAKQRPLAGQPVTIWHNSPAIHVARAEDYGTDGVSSSGGAALTVWTGFVLRPRNLFDSTPLFPQPKR